MNFWSTQRVLVTGGTGFLGRHLVKALHSQSVKKVVAVGSKDYDLTHEDQVQKMFKEAKPDVVFHLAGLVGGILANKQRPADFFYRNLMMGTLVMHHACREGAAKFVGAGAGCGYPEFAPMPLKESDLWSGMPQRESAPYSLAKRLLSIQAEAYNKQFNFTSIICIPGNIYGEFDNFNLNDSHVIPALVRKFVEATRNGRPTVEVWGSGTPTRDYIYAGDAALGMLRAAEVYSGSQVVNLSSGREASIREVCGILQRLTQFKGEVVWNTERPSGQQRRYFDISKAQAELGFAAPTSLEDGLQRTVTWFQKNIDSAELRK